MASSSGSADDLNGPLLEQVWRNLPEELLLRVLKEIPFASLMRFRSVSREWNSLITVPAFARGCQKQKPPRPVPILFCTQVWGNCCLLKVFNAETKSWVARPLPLPLAEDARLKLTASSGGLMCFQSAHSRQICVCNPVTRTWRQVDVPHAPCYKTPVLHNTLVLTGLVVDNQAGTFKLIIANDSQEGDKRTLVYSSVDGSWKSGAPVPQGLRFEHVNAITLNGNIYCLAKTSLGEISVLKYDVGRDGWCKSALEIEGAARKWNELDLLEHQSQLLLVCRTAAFRWLPNNEYHVETVNTFYRMIETSDNDDMTFEMGRAVFRGLERSSFRLGDGSKSNSLLLPPGAITGAGVVMCTMRMTGRDGQMQVLKFNSSTQECSKLPCFLTMDGGIWGSEIRVLEPSLTVDL